jgi:hypothetical protein
MQAHDNLLAEPYQEGRLRLRQEARIETVLESLDSALAALGRIKDDVRFLPTADGTEGVEVAEQMRRLKAEQDEWGKLQSNRDAYEDALNSYIAVLALPEGVNIDNALESLDWAITTLGKIDLGYVLDHARDLTVAQQIKHLEAEQDKWRKVQHHIDVYQTALLEYHDSLAEPSKGVESPLAEFASFDRIIASLELAIASLKNLAPRFVLPSKDEVKALAVAEERERLTAEMRAWRQKRQAALDEVVVAKEIPEAELPEDEDVGEAPYALTGERGTLKEPGTYLDEDEVAGLQELAETWLGEGSLTVKSRTQREGVEILIETHDESQGLKVDGKTYALGHVDKTGVLHIIVTPDFYEILHNNDAMRAELVDHEYRENIEAPLKIQNPQLWHRYAASFARNFADKESGLSPFHKWYLDQLVKEGKVQVLRSFAKEARTMPYELAGELIADGRAIKKYEHKFLKYVQRAENAAVGNCVKQMKMPAVRERIAERLFNNGVSAKTFEELIGAARSRDWSIRDYENLDFPKGDAVAREAIPVFLAALEEHGIGTYLPARDAKDMENAVMDMLNVLEVAREPEAEAPVQELVVAKAESGVPAMPGMGDTGDVGDSDDASGIDLGLPESFEVETHDGKSLEEVDREIGVEAEPTEDEDLAVEEYVVEPVVEPPEDEDIDVDEEQLVEEPVPAGIIKIKEAEVNNFIARFKSGEVSIEDAVQLFSKYMEDSEGYPPRGSQGEGAKVLDKGKIVLMGTGGGKTYMFNLASFLRYIHARVNGEDTGVYVATPQDHLALKDATSDARIIGQAIPAMEDESDTDEDRDRDYSGIGMVMDDGRIGRLWSRRYKKFFDVDPRKVWKKAYIVYGTKSSFMFTHEQELFARDITERVQGLRQWDWLIDEVDKPTIEEMNDDHRLSGERRTSDVEALQRLVNDIAASWASDNMVGTFFETRGQKNVTLLRSGRKELRSELIRRGWKKEEKGFEELEGSERAAELIRGEYYLKIALQAYACYEEDQGDFTVQEVDGTDDIVIYDKTSGEFKPKSEWTDLHNALRLRYGMTPKQESYTLVAMPFPTIVGTKMAKGKQAMTFDGRTLVKWWAGASGTVPEKPFYRIYGKEIVSVASEADANRAQQYMEEGRHVVFHASSMAEAQELRAQLAQMGIERRTIKRYRVGSKRRAQAVIDELEGEKEKGVAIVVIDEHDVLLAFRERLKAAIRAGTVGLVGRMTYNFVYASPEARWEAGVRRMAALYSEREDPSDGTSEKAHSVLARVQSTEQRDRLMRELVEDYNVDPQDIVLIDASVGSPEEIEARVKQVVGYEDKETGKPVRRTGKIAIVNNIVNRGTDTRLKAAQGASWIAGVNLYYDRFIAEQTQYAGRFGRAGDAGECYNYFCISDLDDIVPEGTEAYHTLQDLGAGRGTDPLNETKAMSVLQAAAEVYMDRYVSQAEEQSQLNLLLREEHRELTVTEVDDDGVEREQDVSIWDKFFTMYERLLDNSFIEDYLNETETPLDEDAGEGVPRREILERKVKRVADALHSVRARGHDARRRTLAEALQEEFGIETTLSSQDPDEQRDAEEYVDRILGAMEAEGAEQALQRFVIGHMRQNAIAIANTQWQVFYSRIQDYRKLATPGWEDSATEFKPIIEEAGIARDEFAAMLNAMGTDIKGMLDQRLGGRGAAAGEAVAKEAPPAKSLFDTIIRKVIIPSVFGVLAGAAVALAVGGFLGPLVAAFIVGMSVVSGYGIWKRNLGIVVGGVIRGPLLFLAIKGVFALLSIQGLTGTAGALSAGILAGPFAAVVIAVLALVAGVSLIISVGLSQHLKKIQAADKGKEKAGIIMEGFRVGGLWTLARPVITQLLSMIARITTLMSGAALVVIAAGGVLSLMGISLAGAGGIALGLLAATAALGLLSVVAGLIVMAINWNLLRGGKPLELTPKQRFTASLVKTLLVVASVVIALQLPGLTLGLMAVPLLGIAAAVLLVNRIIPSPVKSELKSAKYHRWGVIAAVPAFIAIMFLVGLTGGALLSSMWAVGLISALLFATSGTMNFTGQYFLMKKNLANRVIAGVDTKGYRWSFIMRQNLLLNFVSFAQALTGFIGVPTAIAFGIKTAGLAVVGLTCWSLFLGIGIILMTALAAYGVYEIISRAMAEAGTTRAHVAIKNRGERGELVSAIHDATSAFSKLGRRERSYATSMTMLEKAQKALEANDIGSAKLLQGILDFIGHSPNAPPALGGKWTPAQAQQIIQETLTKLRIEESERSELTVALLGLFRDLDLISTPLYRLMCKMKKPEEIVKMASLATSVSIMLPSAAGVTVMQQQVISTAEERYTKGTKLYTPRPATRGMDIAVQNVLDMMSRVHKGEGTAQKIDEAIAAREEKARLAFNHLLEAREPAEEGEATKPITLAQVADAASHYNTTPEAIFQQMTFTSPKDGSRQAITLEVADAMIAIAELLPVTAREEASVGMLYVATHEYTDSAVAAQKLGARPKRKKRQRR